MPIGYVLWRWCWFMHGVSRWRDRIAGTFCFIGYIRSVDPTNYLGVTRDQRLANSKVALQENISIMGLARRATLGRIVDSTRVAAAPARRIRSLVLVLVTAQHV
jgi:hypothetical protein